jgi:hypothetical protein
VLQEVNILSSHSISIAIGIDSINWRKDYLIIEK